MADICQYSAIAAGVTCSCDRTSVPGMTTSAVTFLPRTPMNEPMDGFLSPAMLASM